MAISRIDCGRYTAGHDAHVIAVDRTFERPGIDGFVACDGDHVVFTAADGTTFDLWNHRPDDFRSRVNLTTTATLLVGNNLIWLTLVLPPTADEDEGDGKTAHACVNISLEPCSPCGV